MNPNQYSGLQGKRVLITGATSGLGLAMSHALVASGCKVLITGRDQAKIDATLGEFRTLPGEALGSVMDVRDESSITLALEKMTERWNGIDVLVNNAGIGMRTVNPKFLTEPMPFWEVPTEKFKDLIDTNLTGYFSVAKQVAPHFVRQKFGTIVNISMNHETMRRKGFVPYGASRAATESLSQIMSEDLRPFGITVNMLLPGGATITGMIPDEIPAAMRSQLLSADVMAEPIRFLCSDHAKGLTNERLVAKEFPQWLAARAPHSN